MPKKPAPKKQPVKKTVAKAKVKKTTTKVTAKTAAKPVVASKTTKVEKPHKVKAVVAKTKAIATRPITRTKGLLKRRPHRSFRLTRRRDYVRTLDMPGYWSFTNYVRKTLWGNKKLFGSLTILLVVMTVVVSGFGAQEVYSQLSTTLEETGGYLFEGSWGAVGQAGLLLASTVTTGLSPDLTEAQSVIGVLLGFFGWLITIWLLRNTLAGHKPRLRDGLYNSGSPILSTLLVGFVIMVQLLPAAIGLIVYTAAQSSGMLESGFAAMLIWVGVGLLGLISLYWITSSFIALVVVTLPGMYPMHAIKAAGDLVIGRRLRVLLRLFWLGFIVVLTWSLLVIPTILFDSWLKDMVPSIAWLPLVPIIILTMSSLTLVFSASYTYLLYRRIVDDESAPA